MKLAPGAPSGVAIGTQIAESRPAAIRTTGLGTKVPRGINDTRSSVRRGHGVGGYRRRWLGRHCLVLTPSTMRLVGQSCKRFGRVGAWARGLDGLRLGSPLRCHGASARPDVMQHDTEPQESQHHELRGKERWNHDIVPPPWDDRGALYLVFGAGQLSAGYRYTTRRGLYSEGMYGAALGHRPPLTHRNRLYD